MAFSPKTKYEAYRRANGRCECVRETCGHNNRCVRKCAISDKDSFLAALTEDYSEIRYPGFQFHHITAVQSGGDDSLSNCEFLCEECHVKTKSYGRH